MNSINFIFVSHCHQPMGTEEWVLTKAYEKAYLPFIEEISGYPELKFVLHYSGFLLEWLCDRHPDFIATIREMVKRGQIEILSGGIYEPMLSAIPKEDGMEQIKAMSSYIEDLFGTRPRGAWLAERVWEPQLASLLSESGIEYILLDDQAFAKGGIERERLFGRYILEDQGRKISAFPINERLRYLIPFEGPSSSISYLLELSTPYGERTVVLADDGEKYGLWPGTYEWVYESGWLRDFLQLLRENKDSIRTIRLADAVDYFAPWGIAYIPPSSYFEMSVWSLPPQMVGRYEELAQALEKEGRFDRYRDLLGGGMWRNFLVKYSESNNMHKRMLEASDKIRGCLRRYGDRKEILDARKKIWMAQTNCPYWHGVFGGIYLPHLRASVYRNIIEAESTVERIERGEGPWIDVESGDLNLDGLDEVCIRTESMNVYISPGVGGQVYELDYKDVPVNLVNTISRRYEPYHEMLKDKRGYPASFRGVYGIPYPRPGWTPPELCYDWYTRRCFVDHFLAPWTDPSSFFKCKYGEQGDFVDQGYSYTVSMDKGRAMVSLERKGHIWVGQERVPVTVSKLFLAKAGHKGLGIEYHISSGDESTWFGVELNISLSGYDFPTRAMRVGGGELKPLEEGVSDYVSKVELLDSWLGIRMELEVDPPSSLWAFPLETISQSEEGMEGIVQSLLLLFHWKDISGERDFSISWSIH
jgi:hypothetical protein